MERFLSILFGELTYIPNIINILILVGAGVILKKLDVLMKSFECKVKDATKKQYLMILRLMIISEEVPLNEKLRHYDEYKSLGGNSWIDNYVNQVLIPKQLGLTPKRRETDKVNESDPR